MIGVFLSYYTYRLTHIDVPAKNVRYPVIAFLVISLIFTLVRII